MNKYGKIEEAMFPSPTVELHCLTISITTQLMLPKKMWISVRKKGAYCLLSPAMREKLWATYFQFVHPFLPILDCEEILSALQLDPRAPRVSILLFHSVMLISRLFSNAFEGHTTKTATLESMFNAARLLIDIDWETDQFIVLQSLLLLSYYPCQIENHKGLLFFVSHAVSLAYTLGLHQDPTTMTSSIGKISLRNRIWWSLYMRERILSLEYGTPWVIDETSYKVPLLSLQDFVEHPFWPFVEKDAKSSSDNPDTKQKIILLLIEKVKLTTFIAKLTPIKINVSLCGPPYVAKDNMIIYDLEKVGWELDSWLAEASVSLSNSKASVSVLSKNGKVLHNAYHGSMLLNSIACNHMAALRFLRKTLQVEGASAFKKLVGRDQVNKLSN
jgi:hypothetical protein